MSRGLIVLAGPVGFACGALAGLVGFDLLRRRALLARRLVAGAAAAAAIAAPPAPTGLGLWDAILRAGLATGFVLLAGRSRPVWWAPAAAAAAVGMVGAGPLLAAALAVLGAAVALAASGRHLPLAGAVVGALVVQLALRLEWPEPMGATAVIALLALLPMAVSGFRQSRQRTRRTLVRAGIALGVVTVLGVVTGVAAGLLARHDFVHGGDALNAGVAAVRAGDQKGTATQLSVAGRSLSNARDILDASWLLPGRLVPVVAQHVGALQQAARTGAELALTGAETVAASDLGALKVENGRLDLDRVRALRRPVAQALDGLGKARADLEGASSPWLVAPLAARLDREIERLEQSRRQAGVLLAVTRQLPVLLGADGARRYFLAIQNPAELRGSGGIIGSYGEVTAEGGALGLGTFGRDSDLNTRGIPPAERTLSGPPDYLARYERFLPQYFWQNVSVSPHFPAVAEVIAGLYPQSGGSAVDGVITVDPRALAAMLQIVGPVTVPPWPEPITAANAERVLLFDQYVQLQGAARTDFLGDVAEVVARRLTTGGLPPLATIVAALAPAVRGHHLSLWSRIPTEQALFRRVGADGGLPVVRGDSLAVVNVNAGGNKLDWFLRRSSDYRARVDAPTGRVTATLTVTLRNESPPSGLPEYVIGNSLGGPVDPSGSNRTYLSAYSPLGLVRARLDGEAVTLESGNEAGRHAYSLYLVVPPGGTRVLILDLAGWLPAGAPYRLDWRTQPMAVPEEVSARVTSAGRALVARPAGPLTADVTLPSP